MVVKRTDVSVVCRFDDVNTPVGQQPSKSNFLITLLPNAVIYIVCYNSDRFFYLFNDFSAQCVYTLLSVLIHLPINWICAVCQNLPWLMVALNARCNK